MGDNDAEELFGVIDCPDGVVEPLVDEIDQSTIRVLDAETIEEFGALAAAYKEACAEVARMRQRARESLAAERRQVLESARERGYREAFEEVAEELATRAVLRREARREAVDLAFDVARRLIDVEIDRNSAMVAEMIEDLVRTHSTKDDAIEVSVHPADSQQLEAFRDRLSDAAGGEPVRISADDAVERGGCILRTGGRRIDARLEVRLDAMKRAILDE